MECSYLKWLVIGLLAALYLTVLEGASYVVKRRFAPLLGHDQQGPALPGLGHRRQ
jgi:hypothetical protein